MTCRSSGSLRLYITAICQSQRESSWARLTMNPSLPGGLRGRPVWLSVLQACNYQVANLAKWLYMCQWWHWWAAVHKFKLEVNLKFETWQQRLQQLHARDPGCRRSAEKQSALTPQHVGDGHAGGGGAPGGWHPTRAIPPRRCHDIGELIMKSHLISDGNDVRRYWYQSAL